MGAKIGAKIEVRNGTQHEAKMRAKKDAKIIDKKRQDKRSIWS